MDPIAGSLHGAAYDQDEDADLDMASHAEAGREDLQARGFEADASGADALLALATLAHSEPDKPAGKPKKREREQRGDHDLLAHEDAAGLDEGTGALGAPAWAAVLPHAQNALLARPSPALQEAGIRMSGHGHPGGYAV